MIGQNSEYKNTLAHKDITRIKSKCNNMETYSREQTIGKKKVKITLEFPHTVDPKDADRFEHMLKEIYLNKIQTGYLQTSFHAVSCPPLKGNSLQGGYEP